MCSSSIKDGASCSYKGLLGTSGMYTLPASSINNNDNTTTITTTTTKNNNTNKIITTIIIITTTITITVITRFQSRD